MDRLVCIKNDQVMTTFVRLFDINEQQADEIIAHLQKVKPAAWKVQAHGFDCGCIEAPATIKYETGEHENAMAPAIYLNKQIDKVAPHKKQRRGKFKRSSK